MGQGYPEKSTRYSAHVSPTHPPTATYLLLLHCATLIMPTTMMRLILIIIFVPFFSSGGEGACKVHISTLDVLPSLAHAGWKNVSQAAPQKFNDAHHGR